MMLTREQAITEHKIMWNEIADAIEKLKHVVNIARWKATYCRNNFNDKILNNCFLCDYTGGNCGKCPLDWGEKDFSGTPCEGESWRLKEEKYGLWWKCHNSKTWQEQAALARRIANLPERTDV